MQSALVNLLISSGEEAVILHPVIVMIGVTVYEDVIFRFQIG